MGHDEHCEGALRSFIRYGYRKTTMDDVAQEVGVSRQAIYKRFGNKARLFREVVAHVGERVVEDARRALHEDGDGRQRLLQAYDAYAGWIVDDLRHMPHALEALDAVNNEAGDLKQGNDDRFLAEVARMLKASGLPAALSPARTAEVLLFAAKGLLYTAADHEAFVKGMRQTITAVLGDGKGH